MSKVTLSLSLFHSPYQQTGVFPGLREIGQDIERLP